MATRFSRLFVHLRPHQSSPPLVYVGRPRVGRGRKRHSVDQARMAAGGTGDGDALSVGSKILKSSKF